MKRHTCVSAALIVTLLLATILRLWNLDATEFKYDEARVCNLAAHFVDTGIPPVRGMGSSVGIDNPSLSIYLIGLPVLFTRDPLIVTAFVALLNVVGVWACYRLGRRYWSTGVGLVAAMLLAASPWAVFYSRKVWAQNLLLPFVILFFAFLFSWFVQERRWALSGTIITLAALTQIHMATVAFVPLFGLILFLEFAHRIRRRQVTLLWKPLLVGIGASALLYAPYLIFDALTGWRNVRAFVETMRLPAQTHWEAARFALLNIGGREIHALTGPQRFREFLDSILNLHYWPDRIEEALVVVSVAYLAVRLWVRRQDRQLLRRDGLLLLWLVAPILFYLRSKSPVFPHYLIPLYPAPYLALAIGAADLFKAVALRPRTRLPASAAGGLLLITLITWQSYLSLSTYAFVETHYTPNGMGTPIGILRDVTRTVKHYADLWGNRQVVVLCPGDNPAMDECPAVFLFMLGRSLDVRFTDHNASLLLPQSDTDTLIVLLQSERIAMGELDRHAYVLPDETVWLRERTGAYRFYRLAAGYTPRPAIQVGDGPVRLENGVSLLGYELSAQPAPGRSTRLTLYWQVTAVPADPPPQGYSFANHLIAADKQRYGQADGPGYHVYWWRPGDTLLSWFEIPLSADAPAGSYTLRTSMYIYTPPDRFTPVYIISDTGQPIADAIEWPIE